MCKSLCAEQLPPSHWVLPEAPWRTCDSCAKLLSCACKILLPLAVMFPQSSLSTSKCKNLSPKLISEFLFWGHKVRLHTYRFLEEILVTGRKRPCVPGWGHQEGTGNWPVLTSPSLPLIVFFLHCINVCGKCVIELRTLIEKHPLFWLSPPAAFFSSLDRKMLVCVS